MKKMMAETGLDEEALSHTFDIYHLNSKGDFYEH
ncbi:hypothetical protein AVDCRST_MAG94-2751 [uncultured Leptolyngbya sp.]|uniref:Uncharacterized protein n=1 Tax=uncultured Leptolyngbya sp. TaxID=332963 RepID=A0A6J4M4N0_9CYAN|nr:hypothetical protein AVDCRST_MAG94-2751 [uncultured Leptolyngbya sp.]